MEQQKSTTPTSTGKAVESEAAADQSDAMEGKAPLPTAKPSQAEVDRETIDEAIREHEQSGELF